MIRNDLLFGCILPYYGFADQCNKLVKLLSNKTRSYNLDYPELINSVTKHKHNVKIWSNDYESHDEEYTVVYCFNEISRKLCLKHVTDVNVTINGKNMTLKLQDI
jgi:hypothetical protein